MSLPAELFDPEHPFHGAGMELALAEARLAADEDEVPVGAVLAHYPTGVLAQNHNRREQTADPTAHAELLALAAAARQLKSWRLIDCVLYVTLEPCPMCAGAIVQARVPLVVYGATDPKAGACHTLYQITHDARLNHRATVLGGVRATECARLLSNFFAAKRALGKK
jgi:tRNA(adenine34) deaminase